MWRPIWFSFVFWRYMLSWNPAEILWCSENYNLQLRLLWIICLIDVLYLSCFRVCSLLPCGHLLGMRWPLGSRLWCFIVFLSRSHVVSWVRCGTWLYRFLIYATFLTLSMQYLIVLPVNMLQVACAILYTSLYEMLLLVAYTRCKCLDEYTLPHSLIKQSMDIDERLYCNHTCKLTPTEVYNYTFSKTCLKLPPKKTKNGCEDQL